MPCQLVIAVIVEPENSTSPSENPPCTKQVPNDHSPSVSMMRSQLPVISGGIWPAERSRRIHAVSCAWIWPVENLG